MIRVKLGSKKSKNYVFDLNLRLQKIFPAFFFVSMKIWKNYFFLIISNFGNRATEIAKNSEKVIKSFLGVFVVY